MMQKMLAGPWIVPSSTVPVCPLKFLMDVAVVAAAGVVDMEVVDTAVVLDTSKFF